MRAALGPEARTQELLARQQVFLVFACVTLVADLAVVAFGMQSGFTVAGALGFAAPLLLLTAIFYGISMATRATRRRRIAERTALLDEILKP